MSTLSREVSEISREHSDQKHFYIVYEALVLNYVPAEVVPGLLSPFALGRGRESLSYIPLPDVNRRRAVIKNVNALSALTSSGHTFVFDVVRVACPPLTELADQRHPFLSARSGNHDHRPGDDTHSPWTYKPRGFQDDAQR